MCATVITGLRSLLWPPMSEGSTKEVSSALPRGETEAGEGEDLDATRPGKKAADAGELASVPQCLGCICFSFHPFS